jgi:hypothetical protein
MSQMGQEPQRGQVGMSTLPPEADSAKHHWDVRFGAIADIRPFHASGVSI